MKYIIFGNGLVGVVVVEILCNVVLNDEIVFIGNEVELLYFCMVIFYLFEGNIDEVGIYLCKMDGYFDKLGICQYCGWVVVLNMEKCMLLFDDGYFESFDWLLIVIGLYLVCFLIFGIDLLEV